MMMVPKGFRFNPTDEELIQILESKVSGQQMPLHFSFIVERKLYELEPQQLQSLPENERYCYCMRENDSREVSGRGWWKATSHVKKIYATNNNGSCADVIGYKRPLTFHKFKNNGRNRSNAIKTNWIMHEYTLHSLSTINRRLIERDLGSPNLDIGPTIAPSVTLFVIVVVVVVLLLVIVVVVLLMFKYCLLSRTIGALGNNICNFGGFGGGDVSVFVLRR
ncbi:hypothetical protein CUMW_280270 [Citrus unshiu]|uniref:NAC domain-containing protein n=1 Tax=Citrus unshiu TaxID=55188 RepID=A0A2H5NAQ4_CITUN|nr:hypothetical protein CUMW_280270 [Citrus unshiu]